MIHVPITEPIESNESTEISVECPVCKEFIELKPTVNIVLTRADSRMDDAPYRVFIGLPNQECFSTHTCWPIDVDA
jgi:hypothetical protein